MTIEETLVTVIDLEPSADEDLPPLSHSASTRSGAIEGALLVAVGLATLTVEGVARAAVAALSEPSSPVGETAGVEESETEVEGPDEPETLALIAGAGLNLAIEGGRFFTQMVAGLDRSIRPLSLIAIVPPADRLARRVERSIQRMNGAWRNERLESQRAAEAFADALVPPLLDAVIDRLDLTELVIERVALDDVVARVDVGAIIDRVDPATIVDRLDVDSVAARLDVERIVDRLDLVAIARGVIEELNLPEIIRGSTETMAAETRDGVRVQGMRADRFVSHLVDRALLRQNGGPVETPGDEAGSTEDSP
jgi:hypothetical protein